MNPFSYRSGPKSAAAGTYGAELELLLELTPVSVLESGKGALVFEDGSWLGVALDLGLEASPPQEANIAVADSKSNSLLCFINFPPCGHYRAYHAEKPQKLVENVNEKGPNPNEFDVLGRSFLIFQCFWILPLFAPLEAWNWTMPP